MTAYDVIYERFLSKIESYELMDTIVEDVELARRDMNRYLDSAIANAIYIDSDLTDKDDEHEKFNYTLENFEIEVLALLMVVAYLEPKINSENLIYTTLGSKDYQNFSPANHLRQLRQMEEHVSTKAHDLMFTNYYF